MNKKPDYFHIIGFFVLEPKVQRHATSRVPIVIVRVSVIVSIVVSVVGVMVVVVTIISWITAIVVPVMISWIMLVTVVSRVAKIDPVMMVVVTCHAKRSKCHQQNEQK